MILFLDDERMFIESYVEALEEAGYAVRLERNIARALEFFEAHTEDVDLVILDIMFPILGDVPKGIDETKIKGGLRAGEEVLRIMNGISGGRAVPKVILTNVQSDDFFGRYRSSPEVRKCLRKRETLPSDLVKIVAAIIKH